MCNWPAATQNLIIKRSTNQIEINNKFSGLITSEKNIEAAVLATNFTSKFNK